MSDSRVILVTGGSGLVGQAIKTIVEEEKKQGTDDSKRESWIFCGSKDGDLKSVIFIIWSLITLVLFSSK